MRGGYGRTESEGGCLANGVEDNEILYFSFAFGHGWFRCGKWVLDHVTDPSLKQQWSHQSFFLSLSLSLTEGGNTKGHMFCIDENR